MASPPTISDLVSRLKLQPHPEGGFFAETFRDTSCGLPLEALPKGYKVSHSAVSTAIYFLVPSGTVSKLHRIPTAEVWHFYLGDPLTVLEFLPSGEVKRTILGQDVASGQSLQYMVPAHNWFGSYPTRDWGEDGETKNLESGNPDTSYSLVGCTVAPGFEFSDFEMATREGLLKEFPHASKTIAIMTES